MKAKPKKISDGWNTPNKWGIWVNDEMFLGETIDPDLHLFQRLEFETFREAEQYIENYDGLELEY